MSKTKNPLLRPDNRPAWPWAVGAGLVVLAAHGWLAARAGTDIPFQDQWNVEGRWLYPGWCDGTLRFGALFQAYNGQRMVWTHVLNLSLFAINGQWDPLVQMAVEAGLHALGAGILVRELARGCTNWKTQGGLAAGVALAFLPLAAWFNALMGLQTQTYFALVFSILAFAWLGAANPSPARRLAGLAAGMAAMLSMGAGELVPVALLGLAVLRTTEKRRLDGMGRDLWPALTLLVVALVLVTTVPADSGLQALRSRSFEAFISAFARTLAWPHVDQPLAALVLNLPLMLIVMGRVVRRRQPRAGEDFILLLGGWDIAMALAMAWARGGDGEFQAGIVPSRYVDFLVLLPLANSWCAIVLAAEATGRWRMRARVLTAVWCGFLLVGWLGLSLEMWRGIVRPRMQDRLAPVRLAVAFQASGDATVFAGQPRLYIPGDPESVLAVLRDPRMRGRLPPSFQPERPMGPLSRAVRTLLGQ
jgi:hypothetical protein